MTLIENEKHLTCMQAAVCIVKSIRDLDAGSVLLKSGGAKPA